MDKFEVLALHNGPYDFLVIATSYENPLGSLKEIEKELNVKKAKLLFDLTLINGIKKNRYITCDYEEGENYLLSCSLVENINEHIKSLSNKYFIQHEEIVQNSILPNSLKFLIKSGMI